MRAFVENAREMVADETPRSLASSLELIRFFSKFAASNALHSVRTSALLPVSRMLYRGTIRAARNYWKSHNFTELSRLPQSPMDGERFVSEGASGLSDDQSVVLQ
jgi:hypothetical protein